MKYAVDFKPRAVKDLARLSTVHQKRLLAKIETMADNLQGDVKKLTNFTPEFRLRVGDFRVLFEITGTRIVIYRVRHRREAYE
jgi:mRNA interferase RelE/StbE